MIAAGFLIVTAGATQGGRAAIVVNFNLATDQNGGAPVPPSAVTNITNAMNTAVAAYNEWSTYNLTVNVVYNSGVPTADANYNGTIRFGANPGYHNPTVAWHEMLHFMGSGTYSTYWSNLGGGVWTGAHGIAMTHQYYPNSTLIADNHVHWVGGQNPDLKREGVHIMGAMRADMGLPNGNLYDLLGDFSDNGAIGMEDYTVLIANLYTDVSALSPAQAFARGDMNIDRLINYADFIAFSTAYDNVHGAGALGRALGVPEPTAILLAAIGLIGAYGWRPHRRRSREVAGPVPQTATEQLTANRCW